MTDEHRGSCRCKRCGGILLLPEAERDEEGSQIRDALLGGANDEDYDYLHWDYREIRHLSLDDRMNLGTIWAVCNDCTKIVERHNG